MQSLAGDQVAHEDEAARSRGCGPVQHFFPGDAAGHVVAPRWGHHRRPARPRQTLHLAPGGVAVEDEAVYGSQVLPLHLAIQAVLPGGPGLTAAQMMDDGHQGIGDPAAQPMIEAE